MTMRTKLMLPVIALSLITVGMFLVTWWVALLQQDDGMMINLAGRQRMLSQKIAKDLLFYHFAAKDQPEPAAQQVKNGITIFERTQAALMDSGPAPMTLDPQARQERPCPGAKEPARGQLQEAAAVWKEFAPRIASVLAHETSSEADLAWVIQSVPGLLEKLNQAVASMQQQSEQKVRFLLASQAGGIVLGGILMLVAILVIRRISRSLELAAECLSETGCKVHDSAVLVARSSQSIAEGTTASAAAIEETSAALTQLSVTTHQSVDNTQQANVMAASAGQTAETGRETTRKLLEAMSRLQESSAKMADIIRTIDAIASQTNLLALNAAVEAARAGDAGKGFAVVAEEVRNLAQRSASAARSTAALIEEARTNTQAGVNAFKNVEQMLGQIADDAMNVSRIVAEVAVSGNEQTRGIDDINSAVMQLEHVTQANAASSEEAAAVGQELYSEAQTLESIVETLLQTVRGRSPRALEAVAVDAGAVPE